MKLRRPGPRRQKRLCSRVGGFGASPTRPQSRIHLHLVEAFSHLTPSTHVTPMLFPNLRRHLYSMRSDLGSHTRPLLWPKKLPPAAVLSSFLHTTSHLQHPHGESLPDCSLWLTFYSTSGTAGGKMAVSTPPNSCLWLTLHSNS